MMNFCYDVDVKLYSTNLLLMAVYLISRDLRWLIDVFLRNRAARPVDLSGIRFQRRWLRVAAVAFQILFVSHVLVGRISGGWQAYKTRNYPPRPPIYGLYEVEDFTRNGQQVPPLITDGTRWRRLIAETPGSVTIKMMNDASSRYKAEYEVAKSALTLSARKQRRREIHIELHSPRPPSPGFRWKICQRLRLDTVSKDRQFAIPSGTPGLPLDQLCAIRSVVSCLA